MEDLDMTVDKASNPDYGTQISVSRVRVPKILLDEVNVQLGSQTSTDLGYSDQFDEYSGTTSVTSSGTVTINSFKQKLPTTIANLNLIPSGVVFATRSRGVTSVSEGINKPILLGVFHSNDGQTVKGTGQKFIDSTSDKIGMGFYSTNSTASLNADGLACPIVEITLSKVVFAKSGSGTKTDPWSLESTVKNVAPSNLTVSFSSKEENSITFSVSATDGNSDKLTYKIYTGTTKTNLTHTGTLTNQIAGKTVKITATGLNEYTSYYYRVDVSDGILTTTGTVSSSAIRTYCPGTGFTCNDGKIEECTDCGGDGKKGDMHDTMGNHLCPYVMACKNCGKQRSWGPVYCNLCGQFVADGVRECSYCGAVGYNEFNSTYYEPCPERTRLYM